MAALFGGKTKKAMIVQHNGVRLLKTLNIMNLQKKTSCLTIV